MNFFSKYARVGPLKEKKVLQMNLGTNQTKCG